MGKMVTKTKMSVSCHLEVALVDAIKAIAIADERSISYHLNKALREYVDKIATNNPPEGG
jgi:predicted transcriptional regulator